MLPYSFTFFVVWTILLIAWLLLGLPVGPGAGLKLG
jgi:aminobenzoyl-glutamate transport protein